MVILAVTKPIKDINPIFARVDALTKGQMKQEYNIKKKKLADKEQIYKFYYRDGINSETMEHPNPKGIIYYEINLEAIIVPYLDLVVITIKIGDYRVGQLLIDKVSAKSILYPNDGWPWDLMMSF